MEGERTQTRFRTDSGEKRHNRKKMNTLKNKTTLADAQLVIDRRDADALAVIARRQLDLLDAAIMALAVRARATDGGYLSADHAAIAAATLSARATVQRRIAALVCDGLLDRTEAPVWAGRGQQLTLTADALAALRLANPATAQAPAQVSHAPARAKKAARWASPDAFALEAREVNASLPREKQVNDINGFVAYWAAIDEHTGKFAAEAAAAKSGRWSMAGRLATWRQREDTPRHGQQAPRKNYLDFAAEGYELLKNM